MGHESQCHSCDEQEEFGELLKYTGAGFAGGLLPARYSIILDSTKAHLVNGSFARFPEKEKACLKASMPSGNAFAVQPGQWPRRMAGESSLGCYFRGSSIGAAEWSESMSTEWKDFISRFFYALSDQLGANIAGGIFLRKKAGAWGRALSEYVRHPVMLSSAVVVLVVPIGLLIARLLGFSPTTQISTAVETIVANLCWVPPLVGWLMRK